MKNTSSSALTFFIVAGEESGDLHGSKLIQSLKTLNSNISFIGHGGDRMKSQGMKIIEHVDLLSVMGFSEVIKRIPYMLKVMGATIRTIEKLRPDRIILIDYPGFNLRLAKRLKTFPIPITYFILPQMWAWKEGRVKILEKYVNQCLGIFPFEQKWFEERGVSVQYPGHPFSEITIPQQNRDDYFQSHDFISDKPLLALLPGSRQQEVDRHWPIFLKTVKILKKQNSSIQFCIAKAPNIIINSAPNYIKIEEDFTQTLISHADVALASSGTATLECAVCDTPVVVCYKMSQLSWLLIRQLSKVSYASMVNLIANEKVVPEFLQNEMQPDLIAKSIVELLHPSRYRKVMLNKFETVRRTLGIPGVYERTAETILKEHSL